MTPVRRTRSRTWSSDPGWRRLSHGRSQDVGGRSRPVRVMPFCAWRLVWRSTPAVERIWRSTPAVERIWRSTPAVERRRTGGSSRTESAGR
jgi:hypothetical protein